MAEVVATKSFTGDVLVTVEVAVNTFLATLALKDVLDVLFTAAPAGKYGTRESFTGTVVYKLVTV